MYYVYVLKSEADGSFYTGLTEDLKRRIAEHNSGNAKYTSAKADYALVWYCAFLEKKKALDFEKYLKQGSGYAFARKRFL